MGSGRTGRGGGWVVEDSRGKSQEGGGTGFGCPREHRGGSVAPQVHPPALDVGFLARSLTQTQSWKLSELDPKAQSPWDQKEPLAHTQRGSRPSDPLPGPPPSQEGGNTDRSHSLRPNPKLRAEGGGGRGNQNRPQTQPPPPPPKEDAQATLQPTEPRPGVLPRTPSSAAPGQQAVECSSRESRRAMGTGAAPRRGFPPHGQSRAAPAPMSAQPLPPPGSPRL